MALKYFLFILTIEFWGGFICWFFDFALNFMIVILTLGNTLCWYASGYLFSIPYLMTSHWGLEISYNGSIYTMEMGKLHKVRTAQHRKH